MQNDFEPSGKSFKHKIRRVAEKASTAALFTSALEGCTSSKWRINLVNVQMRSPHEKISRKYNPYLNLWRYASLSFTSFQEYFNILYLARPITWRWNLIWPHPTPPNINLNSPLTSNYILHSFHSSIYEL